MSDYIGIELKRIKSKSEPVSVSSDLDLKSYNFDDNSIFVAYLFNEVKIDKAAKLNFEDIKSRLIKLRVFNESRELLLWKEEGGIKGRLRIDDDGVETDCTDIPQVVYGTRYEKGVLSEERGTEVKIPFLGNIKIDEKRNRLFVLTRNYICESGQASYIDSRLVKFYMNDKTKGEE